MGTPVDAVIVGDDSAIPAGVDRTTGRRGLAGTLLVHKIAGYAASQARTGCPTRRTTGHKSSNLGRRSARHRAGEKKQGLPLARVAAIARAVAGNLATANVALTSCSLPGRPPTFSLGEHEMELGLGIHGEAGYKRGIITDAQQVRR